MVSTYQSVLRRENDIKREKKREKRRERGREGDIEREYKRTLEGEIAREKEKIIRIQSRLRENLD